MNTCSSFSTVEVLESRLLCSTVPGLTPAQIKHAYRIDQIVFTDRNQQRVRGNGAGQTIAIIDAFDAPNIASDLRTFDAQFGLPNTDNRRRFVLTKVKMSPSIKKDAGWALETSLDVEWAHAIAPRAHILLVEAKSNNTDDLLDAIDYARHRSGVVAVSMSWGGTEYAFETADDAILTTPAHHIGGYNRPGGITFVSASGDDGAPSGWPAVSPNVVAVAGTTLSVDEQGNYLGETGWIHSGGGFGRFENTHAPDVAFDADPATGFAVYDSTPFQGEVGWQSVGGTSAGSPQWAALIAIADQGRNLRKKPSLNGPTQTIDALYNLPNEDFHDITVGFNGFFARPGYDLVTGRGSPVADFVVNDLVNATFSRRAIGPV